MWDSDAFRSYWAHRCQDSFWWFAREAYNIDGNPKGGWLYEPVHKPLCDWFERHVRAWMAERKVRDDAQRNLLIMIPREFGKTTLITNAGLLWLHLQDPEISVYIGSENVQKAAKFLAPLKEVLNGNDPYQKFTYLYGNWFVKDRPWSWDTIVHACRTSTAVQDPSFGAWGVESGLVGAHPDVLCLDDPISYEKMASDTNWLHKVNNHCTDLIPVLKGNGLKIFIGTRYEDGDHIGTSLRKHGIASLSGSTDVELSPNRNGLWHVYYLAARNLLDKSNYHEGEPILPSIWSHRRMKEMEASNSLKYWAQVMNNPAKSDFTVLTRHHIENYWVAKRDVPNNLRISFHSDTAFKYRERQSRGDETVIEVWGHARDGSGDVYYLEGIGSSTWNVIDSNNHLITMLQKYKKLGKWPFVLTDEIEPGGKGGTWEITLQSWCHAVGLPMPLYLAINRHSKRKLLRLTEAASYWLDGHVKIVEGAPGVERLIDQMIKIGTSAYDDWADTAADVFNKDVYRPQRLEAQREDPTLPPEPGRLTLGEILANDRRRRAQERMFDGINEY